MYKSMLPLLVVLVILSLGFFSLDRGSNLVGGALSDVEGYANSNEFFYDYQNLLAGYDDGELSVVVNAGVGDIFVYKRAYYATDSWVELELESTSSDVSQVGSWNDSWIRGSAEASVEIPYDEYYVAAYVCRLYDHSDVLAEQAWNLGQQLLINNSFVDDFAYLCGVAGFEGGELVTDLWHINQVDCPECAPDSVDALCSDDEGVYAVGDQDWSSSIFCSQGALDGSDPDFPSEGSSVSWECLGEHGGDNRTCSASRDALVPVDAVCGSYNQTFSSDDSVWPTSGAFCDEGTLDGSDPDFPSEGSSVSWECLGEHGGDNRTCSASRDALVPVDAVCGSHNMTFAIETTDWPSEGSFCDPGFLAFSTPSFPDLGQSISWTCEGANDGSSKSCSAKREKPENPDPFVTVWDTRSEGRSSDTQISLPLMTEGNYDFSIATNGTLLSPVNITYYRDGLVEFSEPGVYEVNLTGVIEGWRFGDAGFDNTWSDAMKLLEIKQWGSLTLKESDLMVSAQYFYKTRNLDITATDILDTSQMTDLSSMFAISGVEKIPNIHLWDVSNVRNFNSMFYLSSFNDDLNGWDLSSADSLASLFESSSFNGDISSWDTSNVRNMYKMFMRSSFSDDISSWDVSNVNDMGLMFYDADNFNKNIGSWDVSNVRNMESMFERADIFNQNLGTWNVSHIPIEPEDFASNSGLSATNYPCWGYYSCSHPQPAPPNPLINITNLKFEDEILHTGLRIELSGFSIGTDFEFCFDSPCSNWKPFDVSFSQGFWKGEISAGNFSTGPNTLFIKNEIAQHSKDFVVLEELSTDCQGSCWNSNISLNERIQLRRERLRGDFPPVLPIQDIAPHWNYVWGFSCSESGFFEDDQAGRIWLCRSR